MRSKLVVAAASMMAAMGCNTTQEISQAQKHGSEEIAEAEGEVEQAETEIAKKTAEAQAEANKTIRAARRTS